jgi:hypothetical protein
VRAGKRFFPKTSRKLALDSLFDNFINLFRQINVFCRYNKLGESIEFYATQGKSGAGELAICMPPRRARSNYPAAGKGRTGGPGTRKVGVQAMLTARINSRARGRLAETNLCAAAL